MSMAIDDAVLVKLAAGKESATALLQSVAKAQGSSSLDSEKVAAELDQTLGKLRSFQRSEFNIPKKRTLPQTDATVASPDDECVYFVGNSLGLPPKKVKEFVNEEIDRWADLGVNGHFTGEKARVVGLVVQRGSAAWQSFRGGRLRPYHTHPRLVITWLKSARGPHRRLLFVVISRPVPSAEARSRRLGPRWSWPPPGGTAAVAPRVGWFRRPGDAGGAAR